MANPRLNLLYLNNNNDNMQSFNGMVNPGQQFVSIQQQQQGLNYANPQFSSGAPQQSPAVLFGSNVQTVGRNFVSVPVNGAYPNYTGNGAVGNMTMGFSFAGQNGMNVCSSPQHQYSTASPGSFTFAVPTQGSVSTSLTTSMPPQYVQSLRASPNTFAPGVGSPWQHSIPTQISWQVTVPTMTVSADGISVFQAPVNSETSNTAVSSPCNPLWSSARAMRGPKRHSTSNIEGLGPSHKVHLTDEKIVQHMEELRISGLQTSPPIRSSVTSDLVAPLPPNPSGQLDMGQFSKSNWESFQDLEERLELSDDNEDELPDVVKHERRNSPPKLCILQDLKKVSTTLPAIPKHVLQEMAKPRMEVVLWRAPGSIVKDVINSSLGNNNNNNNNNNDLDISDNNTDDKPDILKNISATQDDRMDEDMSMADVDMQL